MQNLHLFEWALQTKMASTAASKFSGHSEIADAFYRNNWKEMELLIEHGADVEEKLCNWFIWVPTMDDPDRPTNWGNQNDSIIERAQNNPTEQYAKFVFSGLVKRREIYLGAVTEACGSKYAEDTNTISAGLIDPLIHLAVNYLV